MLFSFDKQSSRRASCNLAVCRTDEIFKICKVVRLLRNSCKIFDIEFSIALLIYPQTAVPILKTSEGFSPRSVIMSIELIMLQIKDFEGWCNHKWNNMRNTLSNEPIEILQYFNPNNRCIWNWQSTNNSI